jgi:hypothetical protein
MSLKEKIVEATKGLAKSSEGEEAIAKVSKVVYDHFTA